jgi:lipid A 3-O-deacylase
MFNGYDNLSLVRQSRSMRAACAALLVLATTQLFAPQVFADDSETFADLGLMEVRGDSESRIAVGAGAFNIFQDDGSDDTSVGFLGEFRLGEKLWFFGPAVGVMVNTDGGVYGYGGIYSDFVIGKVILTPFVGVGAYSKGNSKDLGGTFQIRSSLETAYEFENGQRLGLIFAHLSNAGIYDSNPGEEELMLTFSFPLGN